MDKFEEMSLKTRINNVFTNNDINFNRNP